MWLPRLVNGDAPKRSPITLVHMSSLCFVCVHRCSPPHCRLHHVPSGHCGKVPGGRFCGLPANTGALACPWRIPLEFETPWRHMCQVRAACATCVCESRQAKLSSLFASTKSDVVVAAVVAHSAGPHFAHALVQVRVVFAIVFTCAHSPAHSQHW